MLEAVAPRAIFKRAGKGQEAGSHCIPSTQISLHNSRQEAGGRLQSSCDPIRDRGTSINVDIESAVRELAPRLLRYCLARTRDAALAEEIAQDSLTALVQRWRKSGPPDSAEAFVFAVARRRAGRALLRRRLWVPIEGLIGNGDGAPSPESRAIGRIEQRRVLAAVSRLPRIEREALLLVAIGELSTEEAARILRISHSALKMRAHRARRRMVALLEDIHER
jgi:RNA polymerase sigma-70 factor (ECF subfamily)